MARRYRRSKWRGRFNSVVLGTTLLGGSIIALAATVLVFYLIKSALDVDFLPDFSFGVWDWFKDLCHL